MPVSAVKRLEYLRAFLRFCNESGWVESNPAQTLKQTKVTHRPTMPFDVEEIARIFDAAERVAHKGRFGKQIRAMVLLLQYSGLRIQDAACLARSRLLGDKLFLYTQKTATPVYCPLPQEVVAALSSVPNGHEDHFFWDRKSTPESVVKSWDRVFAGVFAAAKPPIKKGHPPVPRHVRGLTPHEGRFSRARVQTSGAQFDQGNRTALLALGEGTAGSTRSRCPANLDVGVTPAELRC